MSRGTRRAPAGATERAGAGRGRQAGEGDRSAEFPGAYRVHGCDDLDQLFPDGALRSPTPWPAASRRRDLTGVDPEVVRDLLRSRPTLEEVDPRHLHAMQPSVTRQGVFYYLRSPIWLTGGPTFRDQEKVANKYPVVYHRSPLPHQRRDQSLILGGHHRAAAALLAGRPLTARVVRGGWGPSR